MAKKMDKRIEMALLSLDPTTKRTAWHGAPTFAGLLRGVTAEMALWRPHPKAPCIRETALHVAFWQNSVANRLAIEFIHGIAEHNLYHAGQVNILKRLAKLEGPR